MPVKSDADIGGLKTVAALTLDDSPGLLVATGFSLLYSIHLVNTVAAVGYLQLFDVAALGSVTLGTTVADAVIPIAASAVVDIDLCKPVVFKNGIAAFSTTTSSGLTANITHGSFFYA